MSDKYGRKLTFTLSTFLCYAQTAILINIPSLYAFGLMRILQSAFQTAAFIAIQTYSIEIVGDEYKQIVQCLVCGIPYSIGFSFTALIAYFTSDWKMILIVLVLMGIPGSHWYLHVCPINYNEIIP